MVNDVSPICDYCKKESGLEWKGSTGATGAHLNNIGWVYKNAFLYTGENIPLAFCSKECCKHYYETVLKVSKEKSDRVSKVIAEAREASLKSVPEMVERINRFSKALKGRK